MTRSRRSPGYRRLQEMLIAGRVAAGLKQEEVAERLKRPQSYVSKYESGERRLDVIELIEVTAAIELDPAEVVRALATKSLT